MCHLLTRLTPQHFLVVACGSINACLHNCVQVPPQHTLHCRTILCVTFSHASHLSNFLLSPVAPLMHASIIAYRCLPSTPCTAAQFFVSLSHTPHTSALSCCRLWIHQCVASLMCVGASPAHPALPHNSLCHFLTHLTPQHFLVVACGSINAWLHSCV